MKNRNCIKSIVIIIIFGAGIFYGTTIVKSDGNIYKGLLGHWNFNDLNNSKRRYSYTKFAFKRIS